MQFDIVIPTIGNEINLQHIFASLALQTILPNWIHVVLVGYTGNLKELMQRTMSDLSENIVAKIQRHAIDQLKPGEPNGSYPRNYGVEHSSAEYIYLLDDDNVFEATFLAKSIADYVDFSKYFNKEIIYSPTINRRYTSTIQSRGIKAFHFGLGRPEPVQFGGWKNIVVQKLRWLCRLPRWYTDKNTYIRAQMIGGNSILAPRRVLMDYQFDEHMAFVYEDLDVTYRITKAGTPLIVSKGNHIYHMERTKTKLEQSFLANKMGAYQKARNRILFVKKNGNVGQRIVFFSFALPVTSLMTIVFIVLHGGRQRRDILKGYWSGIMDGVR